MALLLPRPDVSSLAGRERMIPRIRTRNGKSTVCAGVKDLEKDASLKLNGLDNSYINVNNNNNNVRWWLYGVVKNEIAAPKRKEEEEEEEEEEKRKQDYYVNTGYAIRSLREEFPQLFYRELTFDIYRDDIVFKDPLNTFAGIENYKSIFWALRFHGRIFFRALWVDIVSVWQPVENIIMVRWTVHGIPRIPWESRSRFDGTSEYKLDKEGKIYEHKVHNIALNGPQKFQVVGVGQLIQSIACPSTPKPTYFELASSAMRNTVQSMKPAEIKRQLVSFLTSRMRSETES